MKNRYLKLLVCLFSMLISLPLISTGQDEVVIEGDTIKIVGTPSTSSGSTNQSTLQARQEILRQQILDEIKNDLYAYDSWEGSKDQFVRLYKKFKAMASPEEIQKFNDYIDTESERLDNEEERRLQRQQVALLQQQIVSQVSLRGEVSDLQRSIDD